MQLGGPVLVKELLKADVFDILVLLCSQQMTGLDLNLYAHLRCQRNFSIYKQDSVNIHCKEAEDIWVLGWCLFFSFFFWFCQPVPTALLAPQPLRAKTLPSNPRGTVDSLEFSLQVDQGKPTYRHSLPVGGTRWYAPRSTTPNTQATKEPLTAHMILQVS